MFPLIRPFITDRSQNMAAGVATISKYGSKLAQAGLYALSGYELGRAVHDNKPQAVIPYENKKPNYVEFHESESVNLLHVFVFLVILLLISFAIKMFYKNKALNNHILPIAVQNNANTNVPHNSRQM